MLEAEARKLTVSCGRELLEKGLVARTWGNVSCRVDSDTMVITPSGMDYKAITENDIVKMNIATGEWEGLHKPSGEKGVHRAAYECFADAGFVVHTHQDCASATSLAGFDTLVITEKEKALLGGIALAEYGLPGQKKLTENVRKCLKTGAHTVLMAKHGALICAKDKDEAMLRSALLEKICRRSLKCMPKHEPGIIETGVMRLVRAEYPNADYISTANLLCAADMGRAIPAQLDDMAQMIGFCIPIVKNAPEAVRALKCSNAVLMPGYGAIVNAEDKDDVEALKLLCDKAALCLLHTRGCRARSRVGAIDTALMHAVYRLKYSKQKG